MHAPRLAGEKAPCPPARPPKTISRCVCLMWRNLGPSLPEKHVDCEQHGEHHQRMEQHAEILDPAGPVLET